jgi:hypothetical protein
LDQHISYRFDRLVPFLIFVGVLPLLAPATFLPFTVLYYFLPPAVANLLIASALLGENTFSAAFCQGSQT